MDRWVIEQNIALFQSLLRAEMEPERRQSIERLLAEEKKKLEEFDRRGAA